VNVLGAKVSTSSSSAEVSRDQSVTSGNGEVSFMDTLIVLSSLLYKKLSLRLKVALSLGASHGSSDSRVADVTFVIVFCASTRSTGDDSIKLLSVEALLFWLSPHVSDLLTQPALIVAVSAIVRAPLLVVRSFGSSSVSSLALRLM
jgi:hypothetical protein